MYKPYQEQVSVPEMFATLQQLGAVPEESGNHIKTRYCPFCLKPHNEDRTNLFTFGITKDEGLWNCFRCNQKGNWT